ncbi:MAG: alpha/beta fold hydrolase, partial [Deltaproteobacteria bacterium]|nr:alpha/beta fold hydrolase [Deltaproteobacteria bacterium]
VYLCAFVPLPGESLLQLARQDLSSRIPANARFRPTGVRIQPESAREIFYHGCSDADAAWATQLLRPDPLLPLLQKLRGRTLPDLPCGYIECTQDQAISLSRQRSMAGRVSIAATATLESDHSPFLSAPDELARSLDDMSQLAT